MDKPVSKIGFVLNPIAGMGGAVGLKGTDGEGTLLEARELGAVPMAKERALRAFKVIAGSSSVPQVLTVKGDMGMDVLSAAGVDGEVVFSASGDTTSEDTKKAVRAFLDQGVDLVVFCGGDGTARDIAEVVGDVPVIGIPGGVKMHSAVFGTTPEVAGELLSLVCREALDVAEAEVMDIDEEAYRGGELQATLYGYMNIPKNEGVTQAGKCVFSGSSVKVAKEEIADWVSEELEDGVLYLLGAGSTTLPIKKELGLDATLLGVDAYRDGEQVGKDLNEQAILELLDSKAYIFITPIGAQGFIFGRGNQQFSPDVIRKVGKDNIKVVATHDKLMGTPMLRLDTGDPELDKELAGYLRVMIGYKNERMVKVR